MKSTKIIARPKTERILKRSITKKLKKNHHYNVHIEYNAEKTTMKYKMTFWIRKQKIRRWEKRRGRGR